MKNQSTAVALLTALSGCAKAHASAPVSSPEDGAPALAAYTKAVAQGELWDRDALSRRDRSLVTVAALDHGVAPLELSGLVTHVAFYAGWPAGNDAASVLASVFEDLEISLEIPDVPPLEVDAVAHLAFYCGWPRAFSSLGPLAGVFEAQAEPADLTVTSRAEAPHFTGPADKFTGAVEVESLFHADLAGDNGGGMVHFQPGARTAWHTHPRGQTLIVTEGEGWVQREGGPRFTIRVGDVVRIPPNVRHWHGAAAETPMSHIAIAESVDGSSVTWMELVPDDAYLAGPAKD